MKGSGAHSRDKTETPRKEKATTPEFLASQPENSHIEFTDKDLASFCLQMQDSVSRL